MNIATVRDAARQVWDDHVGSAVAAPRWDNVQSEAPPPSVNGRTPPWSRLSVLPGGAEQASIGSPGSNRFRSRGVVVVSLFVPYNEGDDALVMAADAVAVAFRVRTVGSVVFQTPKPVRVGRSGDWWQWNVVCPWYADVLG